MLIVKESQCVCFPEYLLRHIHVAHLFLGCGQTFPSCLAAFSLRSAHSPPLRQEELEFAIMRIEALKLARQIALAARSRQDTKVPVCCCCVLPLENVVWSRSFFANRSQAGVQQRLSPKS